MPIQPLKDNKFNISLHAVPETSVNDDIDGYLTMKVDLGKHFYDTFSSGVSINMDTRSTLITETSLYGIKTDYESERFGNVEITLSTDFEGASNILIDSKINLPDIIKDKLRHKILGKIDLTIGEQESHDYRYWLGYDIMRRIDEFKEIGASLMYMTGNYKDKSDPTKSDQTGYMIIPQMRILIEESKKLTFDAGFTIGEIERKGDSDNEINLEGFYGKIGIGKFTLAED